MDIATIGLAWALASSDILVLMRAKGYDVSHGGACAGSCGEASASSVIDPPTPPEPGNASCTFPAALPCELE